MVMQSQAERYASERLMWPLWGLAWNYHGDSKWTEAKANVGGLAVLKASRELNDIFGVSEWRGAELR